MARAWVGPGPEYQLAWGGRTWTLQLDGPCPGLRARDQGLGPLLALGGVAAVGRWDREALSGASLIGQECRFGRVEARYAPNGWSELFVRAAWRPWGAEGVDLEVQVHTLSVGQLKALEVTLFSQLVAPGAHETQRWVEPRDARSAALSYDGREPDLRGLTTLPPRAGSFQEPRIIADPIDPAWLYIEMVHPHDLARRIRQGGRTMALARSTRYGLFGHDLEKGVVLRARARGLWLPASDGKRLAHEQFAQFLGEPPPLRT
jgi:hypothetical protein